MPLRLAPGQSLGMAASTAQSARRTCKIGAGCKFQQVMMVANSTVK